MKLRLAFLAAGLSFTLAVVAGCGPSAEEIYAKEQAKIQAEQARQAQLAAIKAENDARLKRIADAENAGDVAVKVGKNREAIDSYIRALRETAPNEPDDFRIRSKVVAWVKTLPTEPTVPDDAMRHAVRGRTMFKNTTNGDYTPAVEELRKAVTVAPWWGAGYNALAVAQESNRQFAGAIQSLKLFLATEPRGVDTKALKTKLYELEVALEDENRVKALTGEWRDQYDRPFQIKATSGAKLTMGANLGYPISIETDIAGNALNGFAVKSAYRYDYCDIPGETNPARGKIANDGSSIEVEFQYSFYNTDKSWVGLCCGLYQCTRVTLMEKRTAKLILKKPSPVPATSLAN